YVMHAYFLKINTLFLYTGALLLHRFSYFLLFGKTQDTLGLGILGLVQSLSSNYLYLY
ncbi:hypothetical protein ACJX0J_025794, partial [Zea mays]